MFAVIFEVQPKADRRDQYLGLAKALKPELETIDGFIDNERFSSRRTQGRLLSLSIWRDEKAVIRWRTHGLHHEVQGRGRSEVLADYHLRVGEITSDTAVPDGQRTREQRFDETEIGAATCVSISEFQPAGGPTPTEPAAAASDAIVDQELFESIYNPGKRLLLVSWRDAPAASRWMPAAPPGFELRHRQVRIIRDYGMVDRREAPQYYPPVQQRR